MVNDPLTLEFFKTGQEFFRIKVPIICGAMTWVSDPVLVSAVSNAGALGVLAAGNSPPDGLAEQIKATQQLTDHSFGVNLITIAPHYPEQLKQVVDLKLPFVIFAGSFPKRREIQKAKQNGAKVLCFASTKSIAERMLSYGADALILEGSEAGGHVGHVSLTVLLQQVLFQVPQVPIFVGGGVATGRMCAHLLTMGAAGVQMGTRFAVAKESRIHTKFKQHLIRSKARNAVSTPQFDSRLPVVAVRALHNKAHQTFNRLQLDLIKQLDQGKITRMAAQLKVEEFWIGALKRAVKEGDIEQGSLMAGQSVGLVNSEMSVPEIIAELVTDITAELHRLQNRFCQ